MPLMIGGLMAAGGIGLGAIGNIFGSSGAKKQAALMREALDWQKEQYGKNKKYLEGMGKRGYGDLQPYRDMGTRQLGEIEGMLANPAVSDYVDPGMDFRMKAGTNAINNSAAARGTSLSGDTLRALTEYGQNMGSQEYGNAFNRWMGVGNFRQGLANQGQNAAFQSGQLGNQNAAALLQGGNQAAANVNNTSANMAPYVGAGDRMWGNFLGGLGEMAMGAGGSMMGGGGMGNALGGIFGGKSSGMGSGAAANQWFG